MNVKEMIEALKGFPEDMPVYVAACHVDGDGMCYGEAGLDLAKPVQSRMDPAMEAELPEDARLGEFVLMEPCGE